MHEGFRFVANLKPYTVHPGAGHRQFGAYLLSIDYARTLADLAHDALTDGAALCADNGNLDLIRSFIARHADEGRRLETERHAAALRRSGHGEGLSRALIEKHTAFADRVRKSSLAAIDDAHVAAVIRAQTAMNPTYLVGMEDFTIATLTALGVEPQYADLDAHVMEGLAKRAVKCACDTVAGRYGAVRATVFAGLHAADYDTARIAGKVAGAAGVTGIATGLAAALQDRSYVDHVIENGRLVDIGGSTPRPYVRLAEIVAGLHVGFVEASGRRPAFHALGAGSPILLPLIAALGDGHTYTSTDSTSPIVDGWSGPTTSLYVDEPAPLKLKAYRIAEEWLASHREWRCPCPSCEAFNRASAPRIDEARRWWKSQNKPKLNAACLRSPSPLADYLPLLGNASDPGLRLTGAMARVGHNHWVLQRLESTARRHSESPAKLETWVQSVVNSYVNSSADPQWKRAVQTAWQIILRAAGKTRGATTTALRDHA